jgi:type IV secretory pathway VirJ component
MQANTAVTAALVKEKKKRRRIVVVYFGDDQDEVPACKKPKAKKSKKNKAMERTKGFAASSEILQPDLGSGVFVGEATETQQRRRLKMSTPPL